MLLTYHRLADCARSFSHLRVSNAAVALLGVLLIASIASIARADLTFKNLSIFPPNPQGEYRWSYEVQIGPATSLRAAPTGPGDISDLLEILDFSGYVPGSLIWTADAGDPLLAFTVDDSLFTDPAATGFVAPVSSLLDNPAIRNLKMTYTGPGFDNTTPNTLFLGTLSARAMVNTSIAGYGISTITGPGGFGTHTFSGALVPMPAAPGAALPEPSSLGLLFVAAAGLARRRRPRAA